MRSETVSKQSQRRSSGASPSRKSMAATGQLTKGSRGRPKASRPGAPRGDTRQNQTTSTNVPGAVPKNFLEKLAEMHRAEKELTLALPLVVKAAKSKDLKTLLQIHLKQTKGHVKTLEEIAASLDVELPSKSCKKMTQLIAEGVKVIGKRIVSSGKDPELIAVGQKIEQFEIASYRPLCAEAKAHEYTHEFALLNSILDQEKLANELLGALGAGKGPLKQLLEKTSLSHAGAG
jgi:ferritin-like metal-binding protein YciE